MHPTARVFATLALAFAPALAFAQATPPAPPHVPLEKTIGQARPESFPRSS